MVAGMSGEEPLPDRRPTGMVAIGLLVGLAAGVFVAWMLNEPPDPFEPDEGPPVSVAPESPEAAEAFIEAWERSRRETYITVSRWHRVTDVGAEMDQIRVLAQRLPDRIRSSDRSRSGQIGDVRYTCDELPIAEPPPDEEPGTQEPDTQEPDTVLPETELDCREIPMTEPSPAEVDAMIDREVELMWRHVEGTRPLYKVGREGDCFHLRLARAMVVPPYGQRTMFCFDPGSGAISALEIERIEGTDTEELLWVTSDVTDEDLMAIIDGSFDVEEGTEAAQ